MKKSVIISIIVVVIIIAIAAIMIFRPAEVPESQPPADLILPETDTYTDVSAQEAKELIDSTPGLTIIDVSPNYGEGHIPGAINHYAGDGSLDAALPNLNKEATYLVYCHFESVSRAGAQKLVDAGIKDVYRLDGDFDAWVEAGYDIEV